MAPLAAEDMAMNNQTYDGKERDASDVLYQNLAKGVQSVKNGEVYTIDEAWEELKRYSIWTNLKNIKLFCRRMLCWISKTQRLIYCRPLCIRNMQKISLRK